MKVLIKVKCLGSEDGCRILQFEVGKEYDISNKLAESLIKREQAIEVKPKEEIQLTTTNIEENDLSNESSIVATIPNSNPTIREDIKLEENINPIVNVEKDEEKLDKSKNKKPKTKRKKLSQTKKTKKVKKSKSKENVENKKKIKDEELETKMLNSYENKAIFSAPKNKSEIIKKIKLKKGNK